METVKSGQFIELALASYGSPLRKPIIGWGLAAALLLLILYSLGQLLPFFDLTKPQRLGVLFTALIVTGAITLIPVLILRWLDQLHQLRQSLSS